MARRVDIRLLLALLLAVVFLGWFVSGLHWDELLEALRAVSPAWVFAAAAFMLGDYFCRAWRWFIVVRHVDANVSLQTIWRATTIGSALNTFLPLRGGDLVKPAIVSRKRKASFTTMLSTTVLERLLDAFGIVAALLLILFLMPPSLVDDPDTLARLRRWGVGSGVMAVVGLVLILFLATRQARNAVMALLTPFPWHIRMRVMRTYLQLALGLEAAGSPLRLIPALFATVLLWSFTTAGIWATFQALNLDLPVSAAIFVAVALSVSISIPQAPGFIGLFQVVMEEAMSLWGASEGVAEAGAFVLWFVYIGPITVWGLVHAGLEGQGFFGYRERILEEAEEAAEEQAATAAEAPPGP